jgi:uncharacterized protein
MEYQYVLLVLVGALTGVLGGMLGIGGSIIMIPAMIWILGAKSGDVEMIHQYQAAAMIVNFLLSIPSVMAHWRNHAIWPRLVVPLMLAGLVGVLGGVEISLLFTQANAKYLRWGMGAFFIYVAADCIYRTFRPLKVDGLPREQVEAGSIWPKLGIGSTVGIFSGMTGLGGGILAVPGQAYLLKVPLRNAIANSSALILSIAWLGAITKNVQLGADGTVTRSLLLTAALAPTAMIGSYIGGHLTHRLPLKTVRLCFGVIVAISTYKMFAG